ncbi:MAG: single-stranded-DNA-specific exonuclease RecJ [Myxococcales bacterium]|nr:single-stranded-DNA-specific exonuclease RecJ [Myxococcales bacterium]
MNATIWRERCAVDLQTCQQLQQALNLPPMIAKLLVMRDIQEPEEAKRFLSPSWDHMPRPESMMGLEKACHRITQALENNERILIFGDYDVDGVTSTTTLFLFLRDLGVPADKLHFFIPHRVTHGYGLQKACFPEITALECSLMITVDCGISSSEEVAELRKMGMDVIIIDHHQAPPELPDANAILNPHQPGCPYPEKILAAVGVTFNLMVGLRAHLREKDYYQKHRVPEPKLNRYLDLVALGTVADLVPLRGVNRLLVQKGLQQMQRTEWLGLRALMEVASVQPSKLDAYSLGFKLGPRINAAGRMSDASAGVELLTSKNFHHARSLAEVLNRENQDRQQTEKDIHNQAKQMLENSPDLLSDYAIVLGNEQWHPGVIGIVASRLMDTYHRPVIVIALNGDEGKGSARSIPGFHLYQALKQCEHLLIKCGGHAAAAGLTIKTEQLGPFREAFTELARASLTPEDLKPHLSYDVEMDPGAITEEMLQVLNRLEPHGMGNPAPVFVARDLAVLDKRILKQQHLKLKVQGQKQAREGIAFFRSEQMPRTDRIALAYKPQINEFNGRRSIELMIRQIQEI